MSWVPDSEDTSGDDGEGEESVQRVAAQIRLLPAFSGLGIFITAVGLLWRHSLG